MITTVDDIKTRIKMWVQRADQEIGAPFLLLVRGVSGVGKESFVDRAFHNVCTTYSMNDMWTEQATGEKRYSKSREPEVRSSFRIKALRHLFEVKKPIILFATAARAWEFEDVLYVADKLSYDVEVWTLLPDMSLGSPNLYEIWQKSGQSHSLEEIEEQYRGWEPCHHFKEVIVPWQVHRSVGSKIPI